MGSSGVTSVVNSRTHTTASWLNLDSRRKKLTLLTSLLMFMTSREMGKKMLSKADVFPMYKACKDSKDQGGFHDFVEILKLYDKNDDNTMIGNELFRLLTNLG